MAGTVTNQSERLFYGSSRTEGFCISVMKYPRYCASYISLAVCDILCKWFHL